MCRFGFAQIGRKALKIRRLGIYLPCLLTLAALLASPRTESAGKEQHLLYVAEPGIRNYVEYGGVGILVFDIDHGHKFVKRIPTWESPPGHAPENVKGIAASAKTGKL